MIGDETSINTVDWWRDAMQRWKSVPVHSASTAQEGLQPDCKESERTAVQFEARSNLRKEKTEDSSCYYFPPQRYSRVKTHSCHQNGKQNAENLAEASLYMSRSAYLIGSASQHEHY